MDDFQFRSGTPLDYGREYTGFQTDPLDGGFTSGFGKTQQQKDDLFAPGFSQHKQRLDEDRMQLQFLSLVLGTGGLL